MKTVKELREHLIGRADDEIIFCALWEKDEADEYAQESMEENALTNAEWSEIVALLNIDDGVWQELVQSKNYYIEKIISERKKGNVHSK